MGPAIDCVRKLSSSTIRSSLAVQEKAISEQPWLKNWQEKRKNKLTASTFGGAIGLWADRRVQLWLEKLGAKEPFSGNEATEWSNSNEKEAIHKYVEITKNDVYSTAFQVYGENQKAAVGDDWLAASPDGLVYGLDGRGVLEIKCPCFTDMNVAKPWKRIPLYYVPQAQGLMEIMDTDWMDFYVWTPNGSKLFRMHRDREYWEVLRLALSDFWLKHVVPARELCVKYDLRNPRRELPSLRPAPKHEYCEHLVNESRRIVDDSPPLFYEIRR